MALGVEAGESDWEGGRQGREREPRRTTGKAVWAGWRGVAGAPVLVAAPREEPCTHLCCSGEVSCGF